MSNEFQKLHYELISSFLKEFAEYKALYYYVQSHNPTIGTGKEGLDKFNRYYDLQERLFSNVDSIRINLEKLFPAQEAMNFPLINVSAL